MKFQVNGQDGHMNRKFTFDGQQKTECWAFINDHCRKMEVRVRIAMEKK